MHHRVNDRIESWSVTAAGGYDYFLHGYSSQKLCAFSVVFFPYDGSNYQQNHVPDDAVEGESEFVKKTQPNPFDLSA
ncbi:MAG: hypothetical protein N839_0017685 [Desulfofustis sp. PB-SRB1]|nr:hypothetical protein [Desulfofustis sp. PB-SRB1]